MVVAPSRRSYSTGVVGQGYHRHCEILVFEEKVMSCITDVYLVALVGLLQVSEVVPAGGMWYPCLSNPWLEIGLHFAAQGGKEACIVVMLSPEIWVG
jgi:hypothetical protein